MDVAVHSKPVSHSSTCVLTLTPTPLLLTPCNLVTGASFAVPGIHLLPGMHFHPTCAWLTLSLPSSLVSNVSFLKRLDVVTLFEIATHVSHTYSRPFLYFSFSFLIARFALYHTVPFSVYTAYWFSVSSLSENVSFKKAGTFTCFVLY